MARGKDFDREITEHATVANGYYNVSTFAGAKYKTRTYSAERMRSGAVSGRARAADCTGMGERKKWVN